VTGGGWQAVGAEVRDRIAARKITTRIERKLDALLAYFGVMA
jgi:hypothetical protein